MLQQITEIQFFFNGGLSGTRHDEVLISDLHILVTHISYTGMSNCGDGENFFEGYLFLLFTATILNLDNSLPHQEARSFLGIFSVYYLVSCRRCL